MTRIEIDGVIGWDVLASQIREQLESAAGDDIDLVLSSPGGSVYEGLSIFNALRDYRREGGKISARIVGLAASMASYIPMTADSVSVEDNAIFMVHNPWSFMVGDYNDMKKEADILDGMAAIMAVAYSNKTGKEKPEIRSLMDSESWFFGEEIIEAGFADSVEPAGEGAEEKGEAVAVARTSLKAMKETMKAEPDRQQMDKAAALIKEIQGAVSSQIPVVDQEKTASQAEINEEEVDENMTIDILKKEHSAVFAEAVEIGVKQERERRNSISAIVAADPENVDLKAVCDEAIQNGTDPVNLAFTTKVNAAVRDGKKMDGENAPGVRTVVSEEISLSAEDKEAAKLAGLSEKEYAELMKEA